MCLVIGPVSDMTSFVDLTKTRDFYIHTYIQICIELPAKFDVIRFN